MKKLRPTEVAGSGLEPEPRSFALFLGAPRNTWDTWICDHMGQENIRFLGHMQEQSRPRVTEGDPARKGTRTPSLWDSCGRLLRVPGD